MANDRVVVRGPREHNLESIDVEVPRDQLVVITGDRSALRRPARALRPVGSRSAPVRQRESPRTIRRWSHESDRDRGNALRLAGRLSIVR
jgi:hypothetical protein